MTEVSGSIAAMVDDFNEMFERQDAAEARLTRAERENPLAYGLVMAALSWEQVDRRGWHAPLALCTQARNLMTAWRIAAGLVDNEEKVASALDWAVRVPAVLERDDRGRYRPLFGAFTLVGSEQWSDRHRQAVASGALTALEFVERGDDELHGSPADLDAAEASYRLAVASDDPDAVALASLRLAELAERLDQPAQASRQYGEVVARRHPIASPAAIFWLARRAARDGDHPAARSLARQVVSSETALVPNAWDLLGGLAWLDDDRDSAVAAMRRAVDTAGQSHAPYTRRFAAMLAEQGDASGAADAYRTLLDLHGLRGKDAGQYVQLMAAAGRVDEAVAILEEYAAADGPSAGDVLLALASAHGAREDAEMVRQVLARIRAHWSASAPELSVPADVMEASLAAAEGDDERAADLFRSLTDTDNAKRRELARPMLLAFGERFAAAQKVCLIPGVRPLLEYLSEAAPPSVAAWAASSLAHLATVEGRPDDAEAGVRLAARYLSPEEVTILRARLLRRVGSDRNALAYLVDACVTATPPTLSALLPAFTEFALRGAFPDARQRARLRVAVDQALSEGDGLRERLAAAMAPVELHACVDRARAVELWDIASGSDAPDIAALAWFKLGLMQQMSAPITAAHALEQAMLLGNAEIARDAATELAWLAERLGDDTVLARASERLLELADGDDLAHAALQLGRINQCDHADDAEDAYHAAIAEPGADPETIGAALARLGALYALHGNRRMARRTWRRGQRHGDPRVAQAFAVERKAIGRVTRLRNR
ncbi:hypothetical protein K1W54_02695 [Micromonospora sp. CPCC 205371]|nr:hypothetical protein [Micromonospora sp. CPCC 205371]